MERIITSVALKNSGKFSDLAPFQFSLIDEIRVKAMFGGDTSPKNLI